MKKMFMALGLLVGLAGVSRAGVALDQGAQPASYGTSIYGSTASVSSAVNLTATLAPGTVGGNACRNCFTKFIVQVPTTTVVTILDGATTSYTLYGVGLGTAGVNTITLPEDHLGPLCLTAGSSTMFNLINTGGASGNPQVINYEGYTNCGVSRNANN